MDELDFYAPTPEEMQMIADLGGFDLKVRPLSPDDAEQPNRPDIDGLLHAMAAVTITEGPDAFCSFVADNLMTIRTFASIDSRVSDALVAAYKMGISKQSGDCANHLGSLYYLGDMVPQDYGKAAVLYAKAMEWGNYQSMINMGYIYEYGRTGEPDFARAYECYAVAAALRPSSEAVYKLGDMYARGQSVERDIRRAYELYLHSFDLAENVIEEASPALRIANLIVKIENNLFNIEYNPLRALQLYQKAEVGLRLEVDNGAVFYKKQLAEAIAGQAEARALLDIDEDA